MKFKTNKFLASQLLRGEVNRLLTYLLSMFNGTTLPSREGSQFRVKETSTWSSSCRIILKSVPLILKNTTVNIRNIGNNLWHKNQLKIRKMSKEIDLHIKCTRSTRCIPNKIPIPAISSQIRAFHMRRHKIPRFTCKTQQTPIFICNRKELSVIQNRLFHMIWMTPYV